MLCLPRQAPPPAPAGTTAGTDIKNVATASYDDPTASTATTLTATSNEVKTTVLPVTGFDIVYSDGSTDDTSASTVPTSYKTANVVSGGQIINTYTVLNNSNIANYQVNFTADTTGTANAPASVKYYPAGTTDFSAGNEITNVTLPYNGQKGIIQVITVPTTATAGQTFAASPKGSASDGTVGGYSYDHLQRKPEHPQHQR